MRGIVLLLFLSICPLAVATDCDALRPLPVFDGGRIKPLDTFARETVLYVTGNDHGNESLDVMLAWLSDPPRARRTIQIKVTSPDLRSRLHLASSEGAITPDALRDNKWFESWMNELSLGKSDAEAREQSPNFDR